MIQSIALSRRCLGGILLAGLPLVAATAQQPGHDVLPSWRDSPARQAILDFLVAVTDESSPDHVPAAERLAVFDNDGTLWPEQPMYTEVMFTLDRLQALAPQHPDWAGREPFRAALARDLPALAQGGLRALGEIVIAAQAETTPDAFRRVVADWMATARHPDFQRPYPDCTYQPMQEALALFRAHGFQVCIASGGTAEFMRAWTEQAYGVPADQVIGSALKLQYQLQQDRGELMQIAQLEILNEGPAKPAEIFRRFGRRPIAAFGNSDGDYEMLQFTTTGPGRRLGVLIHHDDTEREYAYDRQSMVGRLDRGLTDAAGNGWQLVSMKQDWVRIFSAG